MSLSKGKRTCRGPISMRVGVEILSDSLPSILGVRRWTYGQRRGTRPGILAISRSKVLGVNAVVLCDWVIYGCGCGSGSGKAID